MSSLSSTVLTLVVAKQMVEGRVFFAATGSSAWPLLLRQGWAGEKAADEAADDGAGDKISEEPGVVLFRT